MGSNIIYHYTSAEGLRGILSGEQVCLRMTDTRFLNDKEEIAHGNQLVRNVIEKQNAKAEPTLPGIPSHTEFMSMLLGSVSKRVFYSVSFSSEIEQLSQWLSYCPQQGGYAIGFNKEKLEEHLKQSEKEMIFSPVNYVDDIEELIKQRNKIQHQYSSVNLSNRVSRDLSMYELVPEIERVLATSKQSHFTSENECRVYAVKVDGETKNNLEFFNKGSVLVPYIPLKIPKSIITQIIVGPMQHQELAAIALNDFKRVNQYEFTILKSKIPFRCF